MSLLRKIILSGSVRCVFRQIPLEKSLSYSVLNVVNITSKLNVYSSILTNNTIRRISKKKQYDSDDEPVENDDASLSRDSKVVKFNTTSMRIDVILKSAMGVSRNKVEQLFYESKIRINGKKVLKKSASAKIGDEIDVIKMVSPNNSDHLYVGRVEILNVSPSEENITISARRFKHLLIENYEADPHKLAGETDG